MRKYNKVQFIFPTMKPNTINQGNQANNKDKHKYFSAILSSFLIISESLPFMDNIKSNGILDVLKNINDKINKK